LRAFVVCLGNLRERGTAWWGWEDSNQATSTQSCRTCLQTAAAAIKCRLIDYGRRKKDWQSKPIGAVLVVIPGAKEAL
jgi:hypothetical protein